MSVPHEEYGRRLAGYREMEARQVRREAVVGNGRVIVFVSGGVLLYLVFGAWLLNALWLAVPLVAFIVLVLFHETVRRGQRQAQRGIAYYQRALARLDGQWAGTGQSGDRFRDDAHPYAADLDLFGKGSLFELLSTARLRTGEDTLAAWLMAPAPAEEVRARQAAVAELAPRLDLREGLALRAAGVPPGVDLDGLIHWGTALPLSVPPWMRIAATVLPILAILTTLAWLFADAPATPLLIVIVVEILFYFWAGRRIKGVLDPVERRVHDLSLFASILARVEHEPFTSPRLVALEKSLYTDGMPPSHQISALVRLIDLLNSQKNQLFAPIAFLLLWPAHMAFAIEKWRAVSGAAIARWLSAVGDFEALCALAAYAYENPSDLFPEMLDEGPCFDGTALGHPLLPRGECVRNDLSLSAPLQLLMVSGSNMSGKSTFLRTVGINAVLAQAGAPVRAERLRLSSLAIGATLRIQDSLQAGKSRFYAEITRLRQIVDLAQGPRPLLFLLDELLAGTNSHDRRHGADALLRGLLQRGAVGLTTTHDLSLTGIADQLAPRAANFHFEDRLEGGTMTFDYRIRAGVVQHSNAIALMRAVGLEV
ncbi:MAG: hypothetical protein K2R98_16220 [Gemmataceae bacterium]|nr:hypothetical protein [Gemmataceae bacterium]